MSLARAHSASVHLSVAFAFLAMASGGDLPLWAGALFLLALGGSAFFGLRVGGSAAALLNWAVLAALLGLGAAVLLSALDLLQAAATFAALIAVNRLLLRQGPADDSPLFLAALLMLCAGAVLSGSLLFGICFSLFSASFTSAMALSHLSTQVQQARASARQADALLTPRLFAGLVSLSIAALLGSVFLFLSFPRATFGFAVRGASQGPVVGFSDRIDLRGYGTIKDSIQVTMRARISPKPAGERLALYWRGRTYDAFDGKAWSHSPDPGAPQRLAELGSPDFSKKSTRFDIEVLPAAGTDAVFLPAEGMRLSAPRRLIPSLRAVHYLFELDSSGDAHLSPHTSEGFAYTAIGDPGLSPGPPRGLGEAYAPEVAEKYLALPPLDPRIPELARQLTAGLADPFDKAEALARHLKTQYGYTTELPGNQRDPLAHFLFERRKGHCEYFSTALVVMLRSLGIPARNATGFYGGAFVPIGGYYAISAGDAHSWAEVYFPGRGFLPFDATPAEGRSAQGSGTLSALFRTFDALESRWQSSVLDFSARDQRAAALELAALYQSARSRLGQPSWSPRTALWCLLAAVAVAGALALRRLRRRASVERSQATQLYRSLLKRLSRRGLRKAPSATPLEWALALEARGRTEAPAVRRITERYLRARFGAEPLTRGEIQSLRRELSRL